MTDARMRRVRRTVAAAVAIASGVAVTPAHGATPHDGSLGGAPATTSASSVCASGIGVTGLTGGTADRFGGIVVGSVSVQCQEGSVTGSIGTTDEGAGSTACAAGQVAVGIAGEEGDLVDRIALRCRAKDLSGATTQTGGYGGDGGTADGPIECPAGQQLVGLAGTVEDDGDLRQVTIQCAAADRDGDTVVNADDNCIDIANSDQADTDQDGRGNVCDADIGDGRLGGFPTANAASATCPLGAGVTGLTGGLTPDFGINLPGSVTVLCQFGSASGIIGSSNEMGNDSSACDANDVAIGFTGREGDLISFGRERGGQLPRVREHRPGGRRRRRRRQRL